MKSTNRLRIVQGLAVIAICTLAAGNSARAQAPVPSQAPMYVQPPVYAGEGQVAAPIEIPPTTAESIYETGVNYVPDTSPYMARGTVRGCEKCDEGPHTRCCMFNWLTYPFHCGGGEECACPWHHWCPRGHCKVKPTGCTRIDYSRYVVKGHLYKKSSAAAESTAKVDTMGIELYNVYKPCCQNFWLEDGRLTPETDCECGNCGGGNCNCNCPN